jgi:hypothetical protein
MSQRKKVVIVKKEEEGENNHLHIWGINPVGRDMNISQFIGKTLFLSFIFLFFLFGTYLLIGNAFSGILIGCLVIGLFVIINHDKFFFLKDFSDYYFKKFTQIRPFKDISFWQMKNHSDILFISGKKNLSNTALCVFKVKTIPENVKENISAFIQHLNINNTPFTFQVVQKPISIKNQEDIRAKKINSEDSHEICIYFCVYASANGIIGQEKLNKLITEIYLYKKKMQNAFIANYHHFQFENLKSAALIDSIRTIALQRETSKDVETTSKQKTELVRSDLLIKICFSLFMVIYSAILLVSFNLTLLLIVGITFGILGVISYFTFGDLLYSQTEKSINKSRNSFYVNPFKEILFFRFRDIPDSIFIQVKNRILINMKVLNVNFASQPDFVTLNKFFRNVMVASLASKNHFTYTAELKPLDFSTFFKESEKYLFEHVLGHINSKRITEKKQNQWLGMRGGIWNAKITISISNFAYINSPDFDHVLAIKLEKGEDENAKGGYFDIDSNRENGLEMNIEAMKSIFTTSFRGDGVDILKNQILTSSLCHSFLKNSHSHSNKTQLWYLLFQGANVKDLIVISDEFKRGIETRIASEFNTPIHTENLINLGQTFYTETLESETMSGLDRKSLFGCGIFHGQAKERELLMMKAAAECIKLDIPTIVFDFTGNWSRLINMFLGSQYNRRILYFKQGTDFNIQQFRSGIAYDKNNVEYMDLAFDVIALAHKRSEREIAAAKEVFRNNPDMEPNIIGLMLENKPEWEKDPSTTSFIEQINQNTSNATIGVPDIFSLEEIMLSKKTIIFDLSNNRGDRQKIEAAFILIAKFAHYIHYESFYESKILFIPKIDLFFDKSYIEKNSCDYKIGKLLDGLYAQDFGIIAGVSKISYLYPKIIDEYFNSTITFKSTDRRDLDIIKNVFMINSQFGKGLYDKSRNSPLQMEFIKNMYKGEFVLKRADIPQPFPMLLDVEEILDTEPLERERIIEYMECQGYDLKEAEERILEGLKRTLFDKDLGKFDVLQEEIIAFLQALKTVDKIGNNYEPMVKKSLLDYIYEKLSKTTTRKTQINIRRNELFALLVEHHYLEEVHHKRASGSETMRTSFQVGPQFERAMKDLFEAKREAKTIVHVEEIQKESNNLEVYSNPTPAEEEEIEDNINEDELLNIFTTLSINLDRLESQMKKDDDEGANKTINFLRRDIESKMPKMGKKIIEKLQKIENGPIEACYNELLTFSYILEDKISEGV